MYYSLNTTFKGKYYRFFSPFGWLLSKNKSERTNLGKIRCYLPSKATKLLLLVNSPYMISPPKYNLSHSIEPGIILKYYALLLIWLQRNFYPGLWLLSHLRLNIFEDAEQAINTFCKIHKNNQQVLCLPRSVFAATLSKRFKHNGVMIIGAFLPSRHLHAFIIEDSRNPCWFDTAWINYTPIAIMS